MNGANVSDVVFPASPGQLQNFSGDMTETVQITIPAESLERLSNGDSEPGLLMKLEVSYCESPFK